MKSFIANHRLHRALIVLICCGLLVVLMQGTGWLVRYSVQQYQYNQLLALTQSQARQLGYLLSQQLQTETPDNQRLTHMLTVLTGGRHIPDASVYNSTGELLAYSGAAVPVGRRLALAGSSSDSLFSRQIVQDINGTNGIVGFLRLTLDSRPNAAEQRLVDYLVNLLRIFIVLTLIIGVVLARTLSRTVLQAGEQIASQQQTQNKVSAAQSELTGSPEGGL